MAHEDERQFDNLLDNLVSELAMEEVGEPDEPIVRMPEPTPTPPVHATQPRPDRRPARTWVAVTGILAAAGATLGVAAFVIFGGTRAEAAHARPKNPPNQPAAPVVEPAPAPVVPVLVPQPAPRAISSPTPGEESEAAAESSTAVEASASAEQLEKKKRKRKKRRRRSRKTSRKAPASGDRFEDL